MKILTTLAFILGLSLFLNAQNNSPATAITINSFPHTEFNVNSGNGGTAVGMQGTCSTIACCSMLVYKVVLPQSGALRVEMDNFTPLAGTLIAYTSAVPNPTNWSDLIYLSGHPGNFCGFRDTLQLGRGYWSGGTYTPNPINAYIPGGTYYILFFNENNQASLGIGNQTNLHFYFAPDCPNTASCGAVNEVYCDADLTYTGASGQVYQTTGSFRDTAIGAAQGGLDSITFINLTYDHTAFNQNEIADTTLCIDDTLRQAAFTNRVFYADFALATNPDYININTVADDLDGSSRSVFMWMRRPATISSMEVLLGINTSTGGNISNLQIGTNQQLQLFDGGTTHQTGVVVADGLWHHVGYTYDTNSGETNLYVDGNLVQTLVNAQNTIASSQFSLGQEFDNTTTSNHYSGQLTEVSIWNRVLTSSEITLTHQAAIEPAHSSYANLVAYYPFLPVCNGNTTLIDDYSGLGNTGQANFRETVVVNNLAALPNFNSAFWYTKSWSSTNLGANFSTADELNIPLLAADNFTLVLKRPFVTLTENWTVNPRPATQPEISLSGNGNNILNGATPATNTGSNFGTVLLGNTATANFVLQNTGTATLDLGALNLTGVDANLFTLTPPSTNSLAAGQSVTISVSFTATAPTGLKRASLQIPSNDCDEFNFQFDLEAVSLGAAISPVRGDMMTFTGNEYVIINDVADAMDGATEFTIEAWINADASQTGSDRIIGINTTGTGNVFLFSVRNGILSTYDGSNTRTYGTTNLRGTGWHHVAVTHNNAQFVVYLDGVQQGNARNGSVRTFTANHRWSIAQEWDGNSPSDFFIGKMDEVRIWRDVRTQQEIREHMHLTLEAGNLDSAEDNLAAYYQFNQDLGINTTNGVRDVMGHHGRTVGGSYSPSEVAVGQGFSSTQIVTTAGNYQFPQTDLNLDFTGTLPNDEVVVFKIISELPHEPSVNMLANHPNAYWVVNNYGNNTGLTVTAQFNFADGAITDPVLSNYQLHQRGSRDYLVSDWVDQVPSAVSLAAGNNHLQVALTGFSQFIPSATVSTFTGGGSSALPVELLHFSAKRLNTDEVQLNWATANELNNQGFYVERMLEVEQVFESIDWVEGRGTTNVQTHYELRDANSYEGISYYRLKQVDKDGSITYSSTKAVRGWERVPLDINIYPNPTQDKLYLRFNNLEEKQVLLQLFDTKGQRLWIQDQTLSPNQVLQLNCLVDLPPSMYLLSIDFENGERIVQKVIKQ